MDRLIRDADKNLQEHILYLDVVAEVKEGRFNPASDVGEGAWFSKEELGTILNEMHEDTQKLLREAKLLD